MKGIVISVRVLPPSRTVREFMFMPITLMTMSTE